MPDLIIAQNIPQAQIDAVIAAFVGLQGPVPLDPTTGQPVMTDGAFVRQKIREYIKTVVVLYQRQQAANSAGDAAAAVAQSAMSGF